MFCPIKRGIFHIVIIYIITQISGSGQFVQNNFIQTRFDSQRPGSVCTHHGAVTIIRIMQTRLGHILTYMIQLEAVGYGQVPEKASLEVPGYPVS